MIERQDYRLNKEIFQVLDPPARIPVNHYWRAAGKLAQVSFSISSTREGGNLTYEVGTVMIIE